MISRFLSRAREKQNAIEVKDDLLVNPDSQNNSLVIEERKIQTKEGQDLTLQFLATIDSQKEARDISLGFLPYTLLASFCSVADCILSLCPHDFCSNP